MIPEQTIQVCITKRNKKYYENLGYNATYGETIDVSYNDLPPTSLAQVLVVCDNCNKHFYRDKRHINKSRSIEDPLDYCSDCAIEVKRTKTCMRNLGVEYPSQSALIRNKSKETCLQKYGTPYIS